MSSTDTAGPIAAEIPPPGPGTASIASAKSSAAATALLWIVWASLLVASLVYVQKFAPRFPVMDEVAQWGLLPPDGHFSWAGIWRPHNEHRIPLPRLLHWAFYTVTGSLIPALWFQVFTLAAVAALLAIAARKARGRTAWTDVFFPLSWMHVGACANLLSGFQIQLTLPSAIAATAMSMAAVSPRHPGPGRATAIGACLVLLPLCSAVGLVQAVVFAAWAAWTGGAGLRSSARDERRGGFVLLGFVALCVLVCALHVWNFPVPEEQHFKVSVSTIVSMGAALAALAIGPAAQLAWPASGVYVLLALVATLVLLGATLWRSPSERARASGVAAAVVGALGVILAIGVGRADAGWLNGFSLRYVTLTLPILCSAYFAWSLYGRRFARSAALASFALVALAALVPNVRVGQKYGASLKENTDTLERMVEAGAPAVDLVLFYANHFHPRPPAGRMLLQDLCELRQPPFDRGPARSASDFDYVMFGRRPTRIDTGEPAMPRFLFGEFVLTVAGGTAIHFDLRAEDRRVLVRFGIPPVLVEQGRARPTTFAVDMQLENGVGAHLFERRLDPQRVDADVGNQSVTIELPPHGAGELVLRTLGDEPDANSPSWGYWFGLVIE